MTGWRVFDAEVDAQAYADDCWARIVAERDDGTVKAVYVDGDLEVALCGYDATGDVVRDRGLTLRWAVPQQTAKGLWAVECPEFDKGDLEPEWPPVVGGLGDVQPIK